MFEPRKNYLLKIGCFIVYHYYYFLFGSLKVFNRNCVVLHCSNRMFSTNRMFHK